MSNRKHFFRDETDTRTVVETRLTQAGHFIAFISEGDGNKFLRGKGHSRLAAIADLNKNIEEAVQ